MRLLGVRLTTSAVVTSRLLMQPGLPRSSLNQATASPFMISPRDLASVSTLGQSKMTMIVNITMTKYIHYTKAHAMGVLVSDNSDETARGYKLGLEIDCDCFEAVLRHMMVSHTVPFTIEDNVITNENLFGFKNEFIRCMDVISQFANEKYILRVINSNHTVTWYSKETLPKL